MLLKLLEQISKTFLKTYNFIQRKIHFLCYFLCSFLCCNSHFFYFCRDIRRVDFQFCFLFFLQTTKLNMAVLQNSIIFRRRIVQLCRFATRMNFGHLRIDASIGLCQAVKALTISCFLFLRRMSSASR